jgi:hypothetical protein
MLELISSELDQKDQVHLSMPWSGRQLPQLDDSGARCSAYKRAHESKFTTEEVNPKTEGLIP